jgi:microcystin-dependent protein
MSTPYIGEIRMFGFGTRGAPNGWQACDGSLLPISQYDALFALIGTTYGGDGQTTFGVPDLRGRIPIHQGQGPGLSNYVIGQRAGQETVTLLATQMPVHTHSLPVSSSAATAAQPANGVLAAESSDPVFNPSPPSLVDMSTAAAGLAGGNQPHENMMPTLTVQFAIATEGIFPSQA